MDTKRAATTFFLTILSFGFFMLLCFYFCLLLSCNWAVCSANTTNACGYSTRGLTNKLCFCHPTTVVSSFVPRQVIRCWPKCAVQNGVAWIVTKCFAFVSFTAKWLAFFPCRRWPWQISIFVSHNESKTSARDGSRGALVRLRVGGDDGGYYNKNKGHQKYSMS